MVVMDQINLINPGLLSDLAQFFEFFFLERIANNHTLVLPRVITMKQRRFNCRSL